jgi:hypothetical protein
LEEIHGYDFECSFFERDPLSWGDSYFLLFLMRVAPLTPTFCTLTWQHLVTYTTWRHEQRKLEKSEKKKKKKRRSKTLTEGPKTTHSAVRGEAENHTSDWNPGVAGQPERPVAGTQ